MSLLRNEDWSSRQIAGYLALKGDRVSHETIYKWIRADKTGEQPRYCCHRMKYRRHVRLLVKTGVHNIPDRTSIHDRPKEAAGNRLGDWEMDLIIGKGQKSAILTLCERSVNYLIMERLPYGKNPGKVADTVIRLLMPYRKNVLTITTDNGAEFACHKKIVKALGTKVFFADSYASWQKGVIESLSDNIYPKEPTSD